MCEWCERLVLRNWEWDNHADWRGMYFIFKYTGKSKWVREEFIRKEWRRAQDWCDDHCRKSATIGSRLYPHGGGSRFYERRI
jgi:hypothetical protein